MSILTGVLSWLCECSNARNPDYLWFIQRKLMPNRASRASKQQKQANKASKVQQPAGILLNWKVIHARHWKYVTCTYYFIPGVLLHCLSCMYPHHGHVDHTQQFTTACMQASVVMVTKEKQARTVYNIAKSRGRVALDCEGCSLSRTGQLCLVQVSSCYSWHCLAFSPVTVLVNALLITISYIVRFCCHCNMLEARKYMH